MKRTVMIAAAAGATAILAATGATIGVAAANLSSPSSSSSPAADGTATDSAGPFVSDSPSPDDSVFGIPSPDDSPSPDYSPSTGAASGRIGAAQASKIALAWTGGGRITDIEAEREHGYPVWKIEVRNGAVEHEVYVDRNSGKIIKAERDADDSRDNSGKNSDDH